MTVSTQWTAKVSLTPDAGVSRDQIFTAQGLRFDCVRVSGALHGHTGALSPSGSGFGDPVPRRARVSGS